MGTGIKPRKKFRTLIKSRCECIVFKNDKILLEQMCILYMQLVDFQFAKYAICLLLIV